MADTGSEGPRLEIAHILFIDTVGYSKLSTPNQHALSKALNQLIRETPSFRAAEAAQQLIRLPTGDGMVLVFYDRPESPIECAIEIHHALRSDSSSALQLRMGIHSGPVTRLDDLNDQHNVAGAGVNMAQRVMSCADAGHILLSQRSAEDLREDERWRPHLHELGRCLVKHGATLHLVNFFNEVAGNPEMPKKFRLAPPETDLLATARRLSARRQLLLLGGIGLLIGTLAVGSTVLFLYLNHPVAPPPTEPSVIPVISEKSIAVLPLENLSTDKENEFFADGVQDEIRRDLSSVADLKVTSRTSAMSYKANGKRDLHAISRTLGVAYVVEGSVQRINGKVRIQVQLTDARTDATRWSERYDRELRDVFAIQSEVAEQIAIQLEAHLSPAEKAVIEKPPTENLDAFDLYSRSIALGLTINYDANRQQSLFQAVELLEKAVQLDPKFLLAYSQLARTQDEIYLLGIDHTPERLARAAAAANRALALQPEAGAAHLALAFHYYCALDYGRARAELAIAQKILPNEARIYEIAGYISRREGRFEEAIASMQRALAFDPRNLFLLQQISASYESLRRFPQMAEALDRALLLDPHDPNMRVARALISLQERADTAPAHNAIERVLKAEPDAGGSLANVRFYVALCERDPAAAERALAAMPAGGSRELSLAFPLTWYVGRAAQLRGHTAAATEAFTQARAEAAEVVARQPDYAVGLCVLGVMDAALGRKEEAIAEGRRAVALMPASQDALTGELLLEYLAVIYAWSGEPEQAVAQLAAAAQLPGQLTYGDLQLNPLWDALRGRADFAKVVAILAPAP